MTPYETVREQFSFPFELRPYQIDEVNLLAPFERAGYYWEAGSGKTAATTHHALYWKLTGQVDRWLLVMPPILLLQWELWLKSIRNLRTGEPPSTTVYQGTPKKRRELDLRADFILMSYGLLKNDFEYLHDKLSPGRFGVLCDEAHAVKNIESQTHKAVALMAEGRPLVPLTGTPVTQPGDAYAYIKLIAPSIYRNKRHFNRLHIEEMDEWGNVEKWQNLGLLADNMRVQTSRILRREVRKDLPAVIYTQVKYAMDPEHLKLYRRIAEERLVEFDGGKEIDAISASALRSALQQVICNWGEFADDDSLKPASLNMIESYLEELGQGKKLAVVANFRRTNAYMLAALKGYNAVAVYGEVSAAGKQAALRRFITDPSCRVILLQPQSAGFGIDGLQHVCSDMLFIEAPTTAPPFHQTVARLDRDGQPDVVNCRIAVAQGTVQARMFRNLLDNDERANSVQRGYQDLRSSIYGE